MQLSSQCNDCWSSYILSAVNGLTQSCLFKEMLLKCEPIGLNRFVVHLRERHLDYWTLYSDMHPRECNSKRSTNHQLSALPTKRALVTHSPYTLFSYMLLNLPCDVVCSVACFRLRAHTLQIETVTWNHNTSPTCVMLMMLSNSMLILCTMLINLLRSDVLLSILLFCKPIRRVLPANLPATLLILTDPPFPFW